MAPILLKIKGTKLFSPFDEIDDVNDLSTLWRVCTKVKDSLENGSRLENLSWRLWHLHQLLEARGKGKDYRKLSPATTKQLEKTIKRPDFIRKAKPVQIKVRLGKAGDRPEKPDAQQPQASEVGDGAPPANTRPAEVSNEAAARSNSSGGSANNSSSSDDPHNAIANNHSSSSGSAAAAAAADGSGSLDELGPHSAIAGVGVPATANDSAVDDALTAARIGSLSENDIAAVAGIGTAAGSTLASGTPTSALTSTAEPAAHVLDTDVAMTTPAHGYGDAASNSAQLGGAGAGAGAGGAAAASAAEEVQASDFMSFGPSGFLSSGFDLDPPQIEITLDDIFSANSADWSQFGFSSLGSGPAPGLPMSDFATGQGMWNGMAYPGAMPMSAPYGIAQHMPVPPEQPKKHDGPICQNCGVTSTPLWRRSVDDTLLCNACGLYYKLHHTHRPKSLRANSARKDGVVEEAEKTVCTNCKTTTTPLWRRDEKGNPLCNACGLYYKLHKENRPISLKTDVIRKRQRYDNSANTQRKRQDRNPSKQGNSRISPNASSSSSSSTPANASSSKGNGAQPSSSKSSGQKLEIATANRPQQQGRQFETLTPSSFISKQEPQQQERQPHILSSPTQAQGQPPPGAGSSAIPQTSASFGAPIVSSYTANGTQLLNSTDTSSSIDGSRNEHQHSASLAQASVSGSGYRRHSTISELASIPSSQGIVTPASGSQQLPPQSLQHSPAQPVVASYSMAGSRASTTSAVSAGSGGPHGIGGSITIPMSPPIVSRSESYFSRMSSITGSAVHSSVQSPTSQVALPPLSSAQDARYGVAGSSSFAGTGSLHSASSLQPTATGQAYRQQIQAQPVPAQQQSTSPQRPQLTQAHTTHISSSGATHDSGRQLPSLAELESASAAHNSSTAFRSAHHNFSNP